MQEHFLMPSFPYTVSFTYDSFPKLDELVSPKYSEQQ